MRRLLAALAAVVALAAADVARAAGPPVYVQNASTVIADAGIADALPVWQAATSGDFARYWNADAQLAFVGPADPPALSWRITVEDDSPYFDALAVHGVGDDGAPYARVFAATCVALGYNWEVALTHELWEMLADPYIDRAVYVPGRGFYYLETADPVEDDSYAYWRASPTGKPVAVSDFVTENWFRPGEPGPYDFTGHVRRPLQILPGGYQLVWRHGAWTTIPRGARSPL